MIRTIPGLEVIKLEFILKLKIKRNDWLLADTCQFYNLEARSDEMYRIHQHFFWVYIISNFLIFETQTFFGVVSSCDKVLPV